MSAQRAAAESNARALDQKARALLSAERKAAAGPRARQSPRGHALFLLDHDVSPPSRTAHPPSPKLDPKEYSAALGKFLLSAEVLINLSGRSLDEIVLEMIEDDFFDWEAAQQKKMQAAKETSLVARVKEGIKQTVLNATIKSIGSVFMNSLTRIAAHVAHIRNSAINAHFDKKDTDALLKYANKHAAAIFLYLKNEGVKPTNLVGDFVSIVLPNMTEKGVRTLFCVVDGLVQHKILTRAPPPEGTKWWKCNSRR